ncbi:hypothetical protein C4546_03775 [Candidatus Parcubacteria bacterium]|jgi:hypothetical protein|nr:MAG: hypothetical protein C4546_03775 [Candidatus Parcubacteria bacterium]
MNVLGQFLLILSAWWIYVSQGEFTGVFFPPPTITQIIGLIILLYSLSVEKRWRKFYQIQLKPYAQLISFCQGLFFILTSFPLLFGDFWPSLIKPTFILVVFAGWVLSSIAYWKACDQVQPKVNS